MSVEVLSGATAVAPLRVQAAGPVSDMSHSQHRQNQATDSSFRESYEEAKTVAAEVGVDEAMRRLEAHAGQKHPLLKRRQLKDELSDIAKRARFEKRPVLSPIIPLALLLGWQTLQSCLFR